MILLCCRLGPLSIEQKKRAAMKRSKLEKNKEDERKPQELKEEDIARSKNETTNNVNIVRYSSFRWLGCVFLTNHLAWGNSGSFPIRESNKYL